MFSDLKAGAKLKMGAITDNVCACKQSSKIRRWKEEWVQGKSRCDVTGALCRQMT